MSFLAYRTGSHDDFLFLGQRLQQHSITNSAKHSSKSYRRARQCCFWLLAFISLPQVRNIHLPGRMILPESLIPSDKYFLKNLTFVVRNPLVWLRHHSSQTLYVARVKSKQLKSNVLPGLPEGKSWRLPLVGSEAITALHHQQCKALQ